MTWTGTRKEAEMERLSNQAREVRPREGPNWYACFGDESVFGCDCCEHHPLCMELKFAGFRHEHFAGVVVVLEEA